METTFASFSSSGTIPFDKDILYVIDNGFTSSFVTHLIKSTLILLFAKRKQKYCPTTHDQRKYIVNNNFFLLIQILVKNTFRHLGKLEIGAKRLLPYGNRKVSFRNTMTKGSNTNFSMYQKSPFLAKHSPFLAFFFSKIRPISKYQQQKTKQNKQKKNPQSFVLTWFSSNFSFQNIFVACPRRFYQKG